MYVYILFEHQSTPEFWLRFRLLKYMCRIWDDSFVQYEGQNFLKPILPVVFYQGKTSWNHSTQFRDLVEGVRQDDCFIPDFRHFLVDQSGFELDEFKGDPKAQIAQLLLKTAFHEKMVEAVQLFARLLMKVEQSGGIDYINVFLTYLIEVQDEFSVEQISEILVKESSSKSMGDKAMSIADRLREEGFQKGKIIGQIETLMDFVNDPHVSDDNLETMSVQELTEIREKLSKSVKKYC